MKTKILATVLSDADRYIVWHRLGAFAATSLKEERLSESTWETLKLDDVLARVDAAKPAALDVVDFAGGELAVDLDREELSFILATLLTPSERRPIPTGLGRYTAPLRRRLEKLRDEQGMKTTPEE